MRRGEFFFSRQRKSLRSSDLRSVYEKRRTNDSKFKFYSIVLRASLYIQVVL